MVKVLSYARRSKAKEQIRAAWVGWCVALAVLVAVSAGLAWAAFGTHWGLFLIPNAQLNWVGWGFVVHGAVLLLSLVLTLRAHCERVLRAWQWVCWTLGAGMLVVMVAAFGSGLCEADVIVAPTTVVATFWSAGTLAVAGRAVGLARRYHQA